MITIQSAGVLRCCLASIGGTRDGYGTWKVFIKPKERDTDICEYCGRVFVLHGTKWEATEKYRPKK